MSIFPQTNAMLFLSTFNEVPYLLLHDNTEGIYFSNNLEVSRVHYSHLRLRFKKIFLFASLCNRMSLVKKMKTLFVYTADRRPEVFTYMTESHCFGL